MSMPIRVHPYNSKVFDFRGKPIVLVTACEHYGGVMNRPFDGERYLADTAERGINYTRLFTLFRELQSAANPYSTCKPDPLTISLRLIGLDENLHWICNPNTTWTGGILNS